MQGREADLLAGVEPRHRVLRDAVDVLFRDERAAYGAVVDVRRQRTQYQDAVDRRVFVKFTDAADKLRLRHIFGEVYAPHIDARGLAALRRVALVGHVVAVVAYAHDRERRSGAARAQSLRAAFEVLVQFIYDGLALHYHFSHLLHVFRRI